MGIPQLNSCCCGCTLRTGTLIILWLYTIGYVFPLLNVTSAFVREATRNKDPSTNPSTNSTGVLLGIAVLFLLIAFGMVFGVAALYGVYKERHWYLKFYLIWSGSFTLIRTASGCLVAIGIPLRESQVKNGAELAIALVIVAFIDFVISAYLWLVVYSYYRVLKNPSSMTVPLELG